MLTNQQSKLWPTTSCDPTGALVSANPRLSSGSAEGRTPRTSNLAIHFLPNYSLYSLLCSYYQLQLCNILWWDGFFLQNNILWGGMEELLIRGRPQQGDQCNCHILMQGLMKCQVPALGIIKGVLQRYRQVNDTAWSGGPVLGWVRCIDPSPPAPSSPSQKLDVPEYPHADCFSLVYF